MSYCTAIDLIAHDNKARLIAQLASSDYGAVPTADEVKAYFIHGTASEDNSDKLLQLKSRVEQAISNSASEINGYLALCNGVVIPVDTLATINMDMALARLSGKLDDDSEIKRNVDRHVSMFNKIMTGKIVTNTDKPDTDTVSTGAAVASTDLVFSEDTLNGY